MNGNRIASVAGSPMPAVSVAAARRLGTGLLTRVCRIAALLYVVTVVTLSAWPVVARTPMLIAAGLLALTLLQFLLRGRMDLPRYIMLPMLFLAFTWLSIFWIHGEYLSAILVNLYTSAAIVGGLLVWYAVEHGLSWRWLTWSWLLGALVLIVTTIPQVEERGITSRSAGWAYNPNAFALALFSAALVVWCAPQRMSLLPRLIAPALVVYGLLVTGSRGALLSMFPVILLLGLRTWSMMKSGRGQLAVVVSTVIMFTAITALAINPHWIGWVRSVSVIRRVEGIEQGSSESDIESRLMIVREGFRLWRQSPLLGHGTRQFEQIAETGGLASHSTFVQLAVDGGVVGLLLYYGFYVPLLALALRGVMARSRVHQGALAMLLFAILYDFYAEALIGRMIWIVIPLAAYLATRPLPQRPSFAAVYLPKYS